MRCIRTILFYVPNTILYFFFFLPANLTTVVTTFESNVMKHLNNLQSRLLNLESNYLNNLKYDKTRAQENIKRRKVEIQTFNATIHTESNGINIFTYYWRLRGISDILTNHKTKSVRSQSFYTSTNGYRMYLKFLPKFNSELFHVQTGITKGDYDEKLCWPFDLKYRISVLDQDPMDEVEDMVSKIWNPQFICKKTFWLSPIGDNHGCIGISFTEEMLLLKNYVKDDGIIVKFTVFMK